MTGGALSALSPKEAWLVVPVHGVLDFVEPSLVVLVPDDGSIPQSAGADSWSDLELD